VDRLRAFRQGLKNEGYVEGDNVTIVYRWAENHFDRLQGLAAGLVERQVAVIATATDRAALVAKAATKTIPIVFVRRPRPGQGWSCRQPRPAGRQRDRCQFFQFRADGKRLAFLRELVPVAARIAVLVNPANAANAETTLRDAETAAHAMGLQIQALHASTSLEIDTAFATFARERSRPLSR
jgi:putative ABC transport system substrate-binding protein